MNEKKRQDVAEWSRQDYIRWQEAVREAERILKEYNERLTRVDEHHIVPTLEESIDRLSEIQRTLEAHMGIREPLRYYPGRRFSPRRLLSRFFDFILSPLTRYQETFNRTTVHLFNELTRYLQDLSSTLKSYHSLQVQYFQAIVPLIDARMREVRAEENHNVTYNTGRVMRELQSMVEVSYRQIMMSVHEFWHTLERLRQILERMQLTEDTLENRIEQAQFLVNDLNKLLPSLRENYVQAHSEMSRVSAVMAELESIKRVLEDQEKISPVAISERKRTVWEFPEAVDLRYRVFEDIFRGSPEWLKQKFQPYIKIFRDADEPILDIGCGRGEFLELMKEIGKEAYGVDINQSNVNDIKARGLKALGGDALEYVQQLPDESVGGVFCAQVVEHLNPDQVYFLLKHLFLSMRPGNPLVIETVNPLSVYAFHNFYLLDPTHIYPVHPQTLAFFLRFIGFERVGIHFITPLPDEARLPQPPDFVKDNLKPLQNYLEDITSRLNHFLYGPVEYYVVGYKPERSESG